MTPVTGLLLRFLELGVFPAEGGEKNTDVAWAPSSTSLPCSKERERKRAKKLRKVSSGLHWTVYRLKTREREKDGSRYRIAACAYMYMDTLEQIYTQRGDA